MKVIFASYYTCCQNASGGVQNRLRKIASLLEERGIKTELFNPFETKLEKGDILHVFMVSTENYGLIKYAKSIGVRVIISTVVPMVNQQKLNIYKVLSKLPIVTTYMLIKMSMIEADLLITESNAESLFINKYYRIPLEKMYVIPNGVDFDDYSGNEIYERIGFSKRFILQVGRFDTNKNQINVIKAAKNKEYDVVFIGGAGIGCDNYYYEECIKEAGEASNIHFLGWVENESYLIKSAYSHAEAVILPSYYETFGLTAIEGGAKGAKLIFSNTLPILSYNMFDKCHTFNPSRYTDIADAIEKTLNEPKDNNISARIRQFFNWKKIIDEHIKIYKI